MKQCFVVMPSSLGPRLSELYPDAAHFEYVYQYLFVPAVSHSGFEPISPISTGSNVIHADIIRNLNDADLVLGDLSTLNPNVMFELGIRTALNRPMCLVTDHLTSQMPLPFDTAIINRHAYEPFLRPWNIEEERRKLSAHIDASWNPSDAENALWRHFGLRFAGRVKTGEYSENDVLRDLIDQLSGLLAKAASAPERRDFNVNVDATRVAQWASEHRARDPWNMGPKNFEHCLFDLGLRGGINRELAYDGDGWLTYQ